MLATKRNPWYTVSRMKQSGETRGRDCGFRETRRSEVEHIWETFDGLFKTLYRQGRKVEELETRIASLERRLQEREAGLQSERQQTERVLAEMPVERAA
jgi:5-methylthioribose kinase